MLLLRFMWRLQVITWRLHVHMHVDAHGLHVCRTPQQRRVVHRVDVSVSQPIEVLTAQLLPRITPINRILRMGYAY